MWVHCGILLYQGRSGTGNTQRLGVGAPRASRAAGPRPARPGPKCALGGRAPALPLHASIGRKHGHGHGHGVHNGHGHRLRPAMARGGKPRGDARTVRYPLSGTGRPPAS